MPRLTGYTVTLELYMTFDKQSSTDFYVIFFVCDPAFWLLYHNKYSDLVKQCMTMKTNRTRQKRAPKKELLGMIWRTLGGPLMTLRDQ